MEVCGSMTPNPELVLFNHPPSPMFVDQVLLRPRYYPSFYLYQETGWTRMSECSLVDVHFDVDPGPDVSSPRSSNTRRSYQNHNHK